MGTSWAKISESPTGEASGITFDFRLGSEQASRGAEVSVSFSLILASLCSAFHIKLACLLEVIP